jgi:hypothetical protein
MSVDPSVDATDPLPQHRVFLLENTAHVNPLPLLIALKFQKNVQKNREGMNHKKIG